MPSSLGDLRRMGESLVGLLGLAGSAVGVRFLPTGAPAPDGAVALEQHRYCQALMRARHGGLRLVGRARHRLSGGSGRIRFSAIA